MEEMPGLAEIRAAAERIRPHVHRTPVLTSQTLDQRLGGRVYFKCENLQKVGAFKIRGASNAVFSLEDSAVGNGVATHSSGNHAAALALAARRRGVPAYVVMPENAPGIKRRAVAGYGAEIIPCAPTQEARESTLRRVVERTGAHFVPPYDDWRIVAGQGTAALELLEEVPDLDLLLAPVGGGGLISGTALAAHELRPGCRVIAVEPAGADDAYRSFQAGRRIPLEAADTIADGLRTSLSERTFAVLHRHVDAVVRVSEEGIVEAMRWIWERMKLIVEPSGAVPLAALLAGEPIAEGRRVGVILSGGNVDLERLPWRGGGSEE